MIPKILRLDCYYFSEAYIMPKILLTTLNARYYHTAFGLRYLFANLGNLQSYAKVCEFIINQRPIDIAEVLLAEGPQIIGFGVYVWNVTEITQVIRVLKIVCPNLIIVLGGPEVSHEWEKQPIVELADYVITGQADLAFPELCQGLLENNPPAEKILTPKLPPLAAITLPYNFYSAEDISKRLIYVEASRGCPFKCAFCLSALDKTAWGFPLDRFLESMEQLYQRGVRHFKFVDRTFNINAQVGAKILDFFLAKHDKELFLHFELIPDHLPELLKSRVVQFTAGTMQFEIGVQTFNPQVQRLIERKQDNEKTAYNLHWLRENTQAHLHVDLIVGLPGEDLASFATGFNHLIKLNPHEIQVGILKRLRGAPITQYNRSFNMQFNPQPPYNLLCSELLDFPTIRRLERFARYWDLIGNSGRFPRGRKLLLGADPFQSFLTFSDWLFAHTGQTHQFALERLFDLVHRGLIEVLDIDAAVAYEHLSADYADSGSKGCPQFISVQPLSKRTPNSKHQTKPIASRQIRHLHSN